MKTNSNRWSTFLLALFAFSVIACEEKVQNKEEQVQESVEVDTWEGNRAYAIGEIALEATARDTERNSPRPTITSRYLGLIFTAVFDAWSRYDDTAEPVYLTEIERQEVSARTEENKAIAISYPHTIL